MELACIYLQSLLNVKVDWKLVGTLQQDPSPIIVYNLMQRLFNKFTEKLKFGLFLSSFHTLKFLWHSGNAALKQFTSRSKIFIKDNYMCVGITANPFTGFHHIHLLGYLLSKHMEFQKLPVYFFRWINVLISLMIKTGSFQSDHWKILNDINW